MVVATFGRVLAQAKFRRADNLVLVHHSQRGPLRVLALERCVKRVEVVVP